MRRIGIVVMAGAVVVAGCRMREADEVAERDGARAEEDGAQGAPPVLEDRAVAADARLATAAGVSGIALRVAPEKPAVVLGEPIPIVLVFKNVSAQELGISIDPPRHVPLSFACKDEDAVDSILGNSLEQRGDWVGREGAPAPTRLAGADGALGAASKPTGRSQVVGYLCPAVRLLPGQELKIVVALNRYLEFKKAKTYSVEYKALFTEHPPSGERRQMTVSPTGSAHTRSGREEQPGSRQRSPRCPLPPSALERMQVHWSWGRFEVEIQPGIAREDVIEELGHALRSTNKQKVREAAELLLWVDNPAAVDGLVEAAQAVPRARFEILLALRKFAGTGKGRNAILTIGEQGLQDAMYGAHVLGTMFSVCSDASIDLPDDFYERAATSRGRGKRLALAKHLLARGGAGHRRFGELLRDDGIEIVRKTARAFLTRLDLEGEPARGDEQRNSSRRDTSAGSQRR